MILNLWGGSHQLFAGTVEIADEFAQLPDRSTSKPVPLLSGSEVAQWTGADWLVLSESPALPAVPEPGIRAQLLADNNAAYEAATASHTADYPELEKDTWPTQDQEAAAWVADPADAATPWADLAATERGIAREEYLRRTLVKAKQFKILSAFLTGRRQRFEDAIKAGEVPVLDYTLTLAVLLQLQQIAADGMSLPADELRAAL